MSPPSRYSVRRRVAHVSTFPPLRCGIASFATDLIGGATECDHLRYELHYGTPRSGQALGHADAGSTPALTRLAALVSASDCDLVCLQHEFGIWGGIEGQNIHAFLDTIRKPIVSVLHTTFRPGVRSAVQADILRRLVDQSEAVITLTPASRRSLEVLVGRRTRRVVVIPHGIPDLKYVPPDTGGRRLGRSPGRPLRIITPGFFRGDKGLHLVLEAVRRLIDRGYHVEYRIAGEPQRQFADQRAYEEKVRSLIAELHLSGHVQIDARYLTVAEQATAIRWAHLGIFSYQDRSHASSGAVPLVMAVGRPVLCTPFEYARAKNREGQGVFLARGFDAASLEDGIVAVSGLSNFAGIARATFRRTRAWTWKVVGDSYARLFDECVKRHTRVAVPRVKRASGLSSSCG